MRRRGGYDFRCSRHGTDSYVISWTVDMKLGKARKPVTYRQVTDEAAAKRFCRRHKINFEEVR